MKLAVLALVAGCTAPTGPAQTWPPSFGITISAAAFADLDGDGALDIAIAGTGSRNGEGLYLVKGGSDWDGTAIASFTRFVPHPLADVAALAVVGGALVLAVEVKGDATLETLDPETLATLTTQALAIPAKQHLAIASVGDAVVILADADVVTPAMAFPPPSGPHWQPPQAAVGFGQGAIAIATATQVETAVLGAMPLAYAPARPVTDTVALSAQIAATLTDATGAPITAILGVDPVGQELCAIDVTQTTGAACFAIPVVAGARLAVVAGELDAQPGADVAILETTDTDTAIVEYANVVLDQGVLTGQALGATTHAVLEAPIATVVTGHVFGLGISGETACVGDC